MGTAGRSTDPGSLLAAGLHRLGGLLGTGWEIKPLNTGVPDPPNLPGPPEGADLVFTLSDGHTYSGSILVEVRAGGIRPADIARHLAPRVQLMRRLTGDAAVLVIAPSLSLQVRKVLDDHGYGYLDLDGNISFRLNRPAVFIRIEGGRRNAPSGKRQGRSFRGEKAGALIRALVDVRPPYRPAELAQATGLSLPYVSRLLDTMVGEALIAREGRAVADVAWERLLIERSAGHSLFRTSPPVSFVARRSMEATIQRLGHDIEGINAAGLIAITGSAAAARTAPVTAGVSQLMIHVSGGTGRIQILAQQLSLLPAAPGGLGTVLLLDTSETYVFTGIRYLAGLPYVALSQLVLDGLGGTGRMPAESQAVLDHMRHHEDEWRLSSLAEWSTRGSLGSPVPGTPVQ